ncbi:MAG TPA: hypothetical protein VHW01_01035 [Polyangiaceae bacterium]|nr:hypothetical protein [Polyangiaceae bacterium]
MATVDQMGTSTTMKPPSPSKLVAQKGAAPIPRLALNVKDACIALSVSWDVWKAHVEPDVRLVRLGARKLVPVAELERWLADHAETTLERR